MKIMLSAVILSVAIVCEVSADDGPAPVPAWSRTTAADKTAGSVIERGAAVFNNWCGACHTRKPTDSGTRSLQVKYQGSVPAALEDRRDLTPDAVKYFVRNGVATMPFYRKVEISDEDLEALAAYLSTPGLERRTRGN
jgi:mono/diheme cytochrome c family protein